jgi:hypothetical protein
MGRSRLPFALSCFLYSLGRLSYLMCDGAQGPQAWIYPMPHGPAWVQPVPSVQAPSWPQVGPTGPSSLGLDPSWQPFGGERGSASDPWQSEDTWGPTWESDGGSD